MREKKNIYKINNDKREEHFQFIQADIKKYNEYGSEILKINMQWTNKYASWSNSQAITIKHISN